ncbi:hypothetical protein DFJ74DRAFT_693407 [Hyaloraphidium curvatum]|nr:hypothetical protein DFJ74DRAFT_693407 [Hyaloraphidium curvatum]
MDARDRDIRRRELIYDGNLKRLARSRSADSYDALADAGLTDFFSSPVTRRHLRRQGFIDSADNVVSSRDYLERELALDRKDEAARKRTEVESAALVREITEEQERRARASRKIGKLPTNSKRPLYAETYLGDMLARLSVSARKRPRPPKRPSTSHAAPRRPPQAHEPAGCARRTSHTANGADMTRPPSMPGSRQRQQSSDRGGPPTPREPAVGRYRSRSVPPEAERPHSWLSSTTQTQTTVDPESRFQQDHLAIDPGPPVDVATATSGASFLDEAVQQDADCFSEGSEPSTGSHGTRSLAMSPVSNVVSLRRRSLIQSLMLALSRGSSSRSATQPATPGRQPASA